MRHSGIDRGTARKRSDETVLVTWFYFAAILLLVGAAVNCVLAGTGSEKSPAPKSPE